MEAAGVALEGGPRVVPESGQAATNHGNRIAAAHGVDIEGGDRLSKMYETEDAVAKKWNDIY